MNLCLEFFKLDTDTFNDSKKFLNAINIKKGLIYRDWQIGIGELMIQESKLNNRAFEVIGFKDFEVLFLSEDQLNKRWVKRIEGIFSNVNMSDDENNDARPEQIKKIYLAISKLILTIEDSLDNSPFDEEIIKVINKSIKY